MGEWLTQNYASKTVRVVAKLYINGAGAELTIICFVVFTATFVPASVSKPMPYLLSTL